MCSFGETALRARSSLRMPRTARNSWHKSSSAWKKRPSNWAFPRTAHSTPRSGQGAGLSRRRELEVPQRGHRQARRRGHSANRSGASDLALDLDDDRARRRGRTDDCRPSTAASGLDLDLADDESADGSAASDISLEDVDEPTVAGVDDDDSDDALALDRTTIDQSFRFDSAERSRAGRHRGRPPSTIIGKAELDLDADLDLSPADRRPARRAT